MFAREARRSKAEPLAHRRTEPAQASRAPSLPATSRNVCPCGGGCPRCERTAIEKSAVPSLDTSAIASAPPGLRKVLDSPGQALDPQVRARMEHLFSSVGQRIEARTSESWAAPIRVGAPDSAEEKNAEAMASLLDAPEAPPKSGMSTAADFSGIRVHTDTAASAAARRLGASAFTVGPRIVFASGQFEPNTHRGDRLLAHELAHSLQQRSGPPRIARSVDDWLHGTVNVAGLTYTQALGELDELTQWQQRQTASSADTARIEEAVTILRRRVNELEAAAASPTRRERRASRRAPTSEASLPARSPRILTEMTSVAYTDPAEMREEYDLIMQWLVRRDVTASQRRILTAERDSLAPQLNVDRARVVGERHALRLQAALSPAAEDDAHALETLARTITTISNEAAYPEVFFIYHQGERIAISRDQATRLRTDLRTQLGRAASHVNSSAEGYWGRYNAQRAINRDSPIIAGISGWLANVQDPGEELRSRYWWVQNRVTVMQAHIAAGRLVEAAAMMPELDRVGQEIRSLARAFYEGYIEGAEIALERLKFTRDAAFALAGSIAAVVAAPLVAGYVAGAGFTGASATVLTVAGTGTVVGGGMGIVRGGSEAGGVLIASGSLSEAAAGFSREFGRGFREGFVAGAAGGAGRLLGLAAGASGSIGEQVLIRVGGDFVVNATSTMLDVLWQTCSADHCDIDRAVNLGIANGLASIPGSIVGLSSGNLARYFLGPLTAGATSYVTAIHSGATPAEAMRGAGTAVASNLAMSSAQHGAEADRSFEARGRAAGKATRDSAAYATRRVAAFGAATMIGVADAVPPVHSGFGGSPIALADTATPRPALSTPMHEAPATVAVTTPSAPTVSPAPVHESPAGTAVATPSTPAISPVPVHEALVSPAVATPLAETATPASTPVQTASVAPSGEEVFAQLGQELGTQPALPLTGTRAQRIAGSHQRAEAASWVTPQGEPQGPIHAVVGAHEDAPERRQVTGQTGQTAQSAHIGATSLLRTLAGYSRRLALTILMPPTQHRAFDQNWMRWIANRRRALRAFGSATFTAPLSDVFEAQRQAIMQTPNLTVQQRNTMESLLYTEFRTLASGLPNGMATEVPLPAVLGS
jgi:Domain of unknown function (DUF4157)